VDRQIVGRLAIAGIAVVAVAAVVVILGSGGDPAPAAVAVVGEPSRPAPQRGPDQTVTRTLPPSTSVAAASNDWPVTYELTGAGTATVVYDENGLGLVHQELSVALPWRKDLTWPNTGVPPTVQLMGQGTGAVECRISIRGVVVKTEKSAPGEVASCAGRIG
jgi:hypothetical protein